MRLKLLATSLLIALPLTACDPITLALGAGGGYVVSKEVSTSREKQAHAQERRQEREQQYYAQQDRQEASATDQKLVGQVTETLLGGGMTQLMNVHVEVRSGIATLYGTVPSGTVADRAVESTRKIQGVRDVVSRMQVMEMQVLPTGRSWQHSAQPALRRGPAEARAIPPMHPDYTPPGQAPIAPPEQQPPMQQMPPQGYAAQPMQQGELPLPGYAQPPQGEMLQMAPPPGAPAEASPYLPPAAEAQPEPPGTVQRTLPALENPENKKE